MRKELDQTFCARLIYGIVAGLMIAVIMFVAFGVMDIQCRRDPNGPYWNAKTQSCQMLEVT